MCDKALEAWDASRHRRVECSSACISSPCTGLAAVASGLWPKGTTRCVCVAVPVGCRCAVSGTGKNSLDELSTVPDHARYCKGDMRVAKMTGLCLASIFLQEGGLGTPDELARFLAEVERRAYRRVLYSVRDEDAALDIVQDAMLRLADRYAARPADEWPLLFQRILQNALRDHFRRQKVRSWWTSLLSAFQPHDDGAETGDPLEWLPHAAELPPSPEQELDQAHTLRLIEQGLAKLPARQREAFLLRYWEEMDVAETARLMGCSEGSVKTHCSRATHALADWLRANGVES